MRHPPISLTFIARDASYLPLAGKISGSNKEGVSMSYINWAASVAALSGTLVLASAPVNAQQTASLTGCLNMASQVREALANNASAPSYGQAVKEQGYGRDYCTNGFYQNGVAHYSEALKLLGAEKT